MKSISLNYLTKIKNTLILTWPYIWESLAVLIYLFIAFCIWFQQQFIIFLSADSYALVGYTNRPCNCFPRWVKDLRSPYSSFSDDAKIVRLEVKVTSSWTCWNNRNQWGRYKGRKEDGEYICLPLFGKGRMLNAIIPPPWNSKWNFFFLHFMSHMPTSLSVKIVWHQ